DMFLRCSASSRSSASIFASISSRRALAVFHNRGKIQEAPRKFSNTVNGNIFELAQGPLHALPKRSNTIVLQFSCDRADQPRLQFQLVDTSVNMIIGRCHF